MIRKSIPLLVGLAAFAATVSPAHAKAKWVIGMSQCNLGEPWRVQMNEDVRKAAAAHPEVEVVFKDAQNDTLKQRAQIEEFVAAGVNLIIVSPKEAAPLTAPVAEAYKKGIPVIVLDRRVLGDKFTTFIGADNKKIGKAAGQWIAKLAAARGTKLKLVELKGLMTSTPLDTWKAYLRFRLLSDSAPYLSKAFADEDFAFNQGVLQGVPV
ncbi:MAG: substrate-binding domain-containing protein, partial [Deltaproteobacteria bacterium]|nr:substrate-binding domain-containing protein [Deltaproteobacteria bacterium]